MLKYFLRSLRNAASSLLISAAPTSMPLLFSPPIWLSLCPHHPFLSSIFPFTLIAVRNYFLSPPILLGCNGSPYTCFSRATTRMMSWPDGEHYLFPQQSLVVSLLLSLGSTLLFSRTGGILFHRNSSTHGFPRFPSRNLRFYVMLAVLSRAFAATDTAFCYTTFLGLAESKILFAALADTRPRTPLISFCTVQLWTLCVACSMPIFCLSTISGPSPGKLLSFWGFMVFRHQPTPRKGSGNNNNSKTEITVALLSNEGS